MFFVEGPIGAGKTTFLRLIQEKLPELAVVFEPLHSWENKVYGQSILANFYKDPHRWAYTMETLAMACRVQEHLREQQNPNPFRLMERSIYSGHYVFATNGYHNGFLDELEWRVYLEWFNFLVTGRCKAPQGFIYLKVDPEIAYERIKKRDRDAEKTISLEYIKQIHQCHEDFLVHKKNLLTELKNVPVLILNCNEEFEADAEMFDLHAQKVFAFVNSSGERPIKETMLGV
jgi:deoxyadenosine/deoxycytidine kinase